MSELPPVTEINPEPSPRPADGGSRGSADRLWAAAAHAGALVAGFLAPLLVLATRGEQSSWVRDQAVEALNFQITVLLALAASAFFAFALLGAITGPLVAVAAFVLAALAGHRAWKGETFRYPLVWRLLK